MKTGVMSSHTIAERLRQSAQVIHGSTSLEQIGEQTVELGGILQRSSESLNSQEDMLPCMKFRSQLETTAAADK